MGEEKENQTREAPESRGEKKESAAEREKRLKREREARRKSPKERAKFRREIEKLEEREKHHYDLDEFEGAKLKKKFDTVVGSVDATPYPTRLRKEKWYKDKGVAAKLLLKVYDKKKDRFTDDAQDLIKKHLSMLRKLGKQTDFTPTKFRKSFEKGYSKEKLFGTHGIYNFVLTFQRVMDAFKHDSGKLLKSKCRIHLTVGKEQRSRDERFVQTYASKKKKKDTKPGKAIPLPPPETEPEVVPGTEGKAPAPAEQEDYPDIMGSPERSYLAVTHGPGGLIPTAETFGERIDTQQASTELVDSYNRIGMMALIEGLNKIPPGQREEVLAAVFKQVGETDGAKAFELLKEIIKFEKGNQEKAVLDGLKAKIEAPGVPENEKNYWRAQLLLFEIGQVDAKGRPKLSSVQSQQKMRQIMKVMSDVDVDALPEEIREMAKQQKEFLEINMRQSISADLIETGTLSLNAMMKDMKRDDVWFVKSFEEMKEIYQSRGKQAIAEHLAEGIDKDSDVYIAASHVFEALRLLVTYQYPKDAQKEEIQNPIEHYYNKLMSGEITEIELEEGQAAQVNDVLLDNPRTITGPGKIDLDDLFCAKEEEKRLFEQFQSGEERLGEMGIWTTIKNTRDSVMETIIPKGWWSENLGYAAMVFPPTFGAGLLVQALPDAFADDQTAFMETDDGGFIQSSSEMFPPMGQLSKFMQENPGGTTGNMENLGAAEKVQLAKIEQLIQVEHYDEARALLIDILQDRLAAKSKMSAEGISEQSEDYKEIYEDYGDKIKAQVRIQLREAGIDETNFKQAQIPRPSGGYYIDYVTYLDDKVKEVLKGRLYMKHQGDVADNFTEAEINEMSQYEREALEELNYLNGHTYKTLWMTAKHADIAKDVAQMVAEIIIIEAITLGAGTYIAAASGAARAGQIAIKVGAYTQRAGKLWSVGRQVPKAVSFAQRAGKTSWLAGRIGKGATGVGGQIGAGVRWVAEGGSWTARGTKTGLHAASFVQLQNAMHGGPINLTTGGGWSQAAAETAKMALVFGVLGKAQGLVRGETAGAKTIAEAASRGESIAAKGFQKVNPFYRVSQSSYHLGRMNKWLTYQGRAGEKAATSIEMAAEVGALHSLHWAEEEITINMVDYVEMITGKRYQSLEEMADEKIAMKDPEVWGQLAQTAGVVLGLRTWRGMRHKLDTRGRRMDLGKLTERLGKTENLSAEENAYVAGQMRRLALEVKKAKSAKEVEDITREIFGIEADVPLTRENFNQHTAEKLIPKLEAKIPELRRKIDNATETLRSIKEQVQALNKVIKGPTKEDLRKPDPENPTPDQKEAIERRGELERHRGELQRLKRSWSEESKGLERRKAVIEKYVEAAKRSIFERPPVLTTEEREQSVKEHKEALELIEKRLTEIEQKLQGVNPSLLTDAQRANIAKRAELLESKAEIQQNLDRILQTEPATVQAARDNIGDARKDIRKLDRAIGKLNRQLRGVDGSRATREQSEMFTKRAELKRQKAALEGQIEAILLQTPLAAKEAPKESIWQRLGRLKAKAGEGIGKAKERLSRGGAYKRAKEAYKQAEKANKQAQEELQKIREDETSGDKGAAEIRAEIVERSAKDAETAAEAAKVAYELAVVRGVAVHKGVKPSDTFTPSAAEIRAAMAAEKAGTLKGVRMHEAVKAYTDARHQAKEAKKAATEAREIADRIPGPRVSPLEKARQANQDNNITGAREAAKEAEVEAEQAAVAQREALRKIRGAADKNAARAEYEAEKTKAEEAQREAIEARELATEISLRDQYGTAAPEVAKNLEAFIRNTSDQQNLDAVRTNQLREAVLLKIEFNPQQGVRGNELAQLFDAAKNEFLNPPTT